jgi:hypothetical protein
MVTLLIRDQARNTVAMMRNISESYALELIAEWILEGALEDDGLRVEVLREVAQLEAVAQ